MKVSGDNRKSRSSTPLTLDLDSIMEAGRVSQGSSQILKPLMPGKGQLG